MQRLNDMESERNTLYWTQPNQAYRLVSSYYDWQVACVGIKLPIVLKHKKISQNPQSLLALPLWQHPSCAMTYHRPVCQHA